MDKLFENAQLVVGFPSSKEGKKPLPTKPKICNYYLLEGDLVLVIA